MVLVLVYYLRLSWSLAVGMFLLVGLFSYCAHCLDKWMGASLWILALALFFLAWVGQFYGHRIEAQKPSFYKDLQFLLIGPAWLMHFVYKRLGLRY